MIQTISISVYDTSLPPFSQEVLDFAQKGSIRWEWEGGDDKMIAIMGSRLEFDMEVSIEDSLQTLVYDYLFTGSETRYKVVMRDQNENTLWQGFLLPEEYSEPYTTGTFFVHLTATDGLGRLKGQTLDRQFYRVKNSVPKLIADCLKKTGLSLEIWINPAIGNGIAPKLWHHVYVDGNDWKDDDSLADCYEILESLLMEMGCTLYQQNNKWFISSWTERSKPDLSPQWQIYDENGKFQNTGSELGQNRDTMIQWYATPTISIKPPFKEVKVITGIDENIDLFPEDIVKQSWEIKSEETEAPPQVKYWKATEGIDVKLFPVSMGSEFKEYEVGEIEESGVVGFKTIASVPDTADDFITMKNPVFVKPGAVDIELGISILADLAQVGGRSFEYYSSIMTVVLTLDDIVFAKTGLAVPGGRLFQWEGEVASVPGVDDKVTMRLSVKKFKMEGSGFLNIKIIHPETSISPPDWDIRIDNFSLQYSDPFKNTFLRRRNIDFTSKKEISLFHGDTVFDQVPNKFIVQSPPVLSHFQELPIYGGRVINNSWASEITLASYGLINANENKIFLLRANSDYYEYVPELRTITQFFGTQFFAILTLPDNYKATTGDKILIYSGPLPNDPQTTQNHNLRENWWKNTHPAGKQRLGEALAETVHNIYPTQLVMFEGNMKGIVQPDNVLSFEVRNEMKYFIPLRIEVKPNENESSVTLLEYKNEKVSDYGG